MVWGDVGQGGCDMVLGDSGLSVTQLGDTERPVSIRFG